MSRKMIILYIFIISLVRSFFWDIEFELDVMFGAGFALLAQYMWGVDQ